MENNEAIQEKIQALEKQLEGVRQRTRQIFTDGKEASKINELPDLNASINLERHKNSKLFQRFLEREGMNLDKDKPKVIEKKQKELEQEVPVRESKPEVKKQVIERSSPDRENKSFLQDEELQGYSEHVPADADQETMFSLTTKPNREPPTKKLTNTVSKTQDSPNYEDVYPRKGNQNQFDMANHGYIESRFDDSVQYEPDTYSPPQDSRQLDYNEYQDYRLPAHSKETRYPEPTYKESHGSSRDTPPNRPYSEESYDPYYSESRKPYGAQNTDGFNTFQDPVPNMIHQHSLPSISQNIPNMPNLSGMPNMANLPGMPNMAGIPGQFMPMYPPVFYPNQPMDMMFRPPQYDMMHNSIPQMPYYSNNDSRLKDELGRQRRDFDDQLAKKDAELRNAQKTLENAKLDIMQLEDQLNNGGDLQRKFSNLKVERDMLDRKYQANEDEIIKMSRSYDQLKDTYDGLKGQYDDMERSARAKVSDLERDLRSLQVKLEDAETEIDRERERAVDFERKFNGVKDKCVAYERDLERAEDRIDRLERELEDMKNKQTYEARNKNSEADGLRRQVASLTQAIEDLRRTGSYKKEEPIRGSYIKEEPTRASYIKEEPPRGSYSKRREQDTGYVRYEEPQPSYSRYEEPEMNYSRYEEPEYGRRNYREDRPIQDMEEGKDIYNKRDYLTDNTRDLPKKPVEESGPIRGRNVERTNNSKSVGSALHWEEPSRNERKSKRNNEPEGNAVQNLENKLMTLQLEKQKLESEFSKIPEHAKQIAVRRRREELELELSILDTNITNIRNKLRGMNALH